MPTLTTPARLQMHIGGRWVDSISGETFERVSPVTGQVIGTLPKAGRDDARHAVRDANRARARIASMPVFERAKLCRRIGDSLTDRADVMAEQLSLEQGKPRAEARAEVLFAADLYRDAGEYATRLAGEMMPSVDPNKRVITLRQPHGVVAVLTPWNYPVGIPSEYLSAALAGGNAVVWKPAPTTSMIAVRLLECILAAGVPASPIDAVQPEPGSALRRVRDDTEALRMTFQRDLIARIRPRSPSIGRCPPPGAPRRRGRLH